MFNNWKQRLLSGWSFMRFIRLGLAILVIVEAIKNSEIIFALLGGILLFQAAFNYGCCGSSGCDINHTLRRAKSSQERVEDVTFKEVK